MGADRLVSYAYTEFALHAEYIRTALHEGRTGGGAVSSGTSGVQCILYAEVLGKRKIIFKSPHLFGVEVEAIRASAVDDDSAKLCVGADGKWRRGFVSRVSQSTVCKTIQLFNINSTMARGKFLIF